MNSQNSGNAFVTVVTLVILFLWLYIPYLVISWIYRWATSPSIEDRLREVTAMAEDSPTFEQLEDLRSEFEELRSDVRACGCKSR